MAKIERKFMAHYMDATPTATATYERLGADLEELNVEMNAEIETTANILGENSTKLSSYAAQASVEPYYADESSPFFEFLQNIVDNRKVLDDCKTSTLEVHLWDGAESAYTAYKESAVVEIVSYGGDTTGYQIAFNVHYQGDRVKGTFNPNTKTFTEGA